MHVLFVNHKCGFYGGVEQHVYDAAGALQKRGHTCSLAYGHRTQQEADRFASGFSHTQACESLREGSGARGLDLDGVVNALAPDLLYLHKLPSLAAVGPVARRTPVVRMIHDHDVCCPRRHKYFACSGRVCKHPAGWRCWLDGAFLERSADGRAGVRWRSLPAHARELARNRGLQKVVVASRFMAHELRQNGFDPERVEVLPPGIHIPPGEPSPVPEAARILFAGQLIRGKGVDLLLKAVAASSEAATVDIVGDGSARPDLERLSEELGLQGRVSFQGWVPNETLAAIYQKAKLVALPSRWPEPYGLVGLEAMAGGRPVVAFNVGGVTDWLSHGETGFVVPEQNVDAFARALDVLLADTSLARRMGREARAQVCLRFGFDDYADRLEAFLASEIQAPRAALREAGRV